MMTLRFSKTAFVIRVFRDVFYCTVLFALFVFSSCTGDNNQTNTPTNLKDTANATDTAAKTTSKDSLYTLYIENDAANSDLGKLIGTSKDMKKLVFQFQRDSAGYLGLLVFPYQPNGKNIIPNRVIEVKRSNRATELLPTDSISFGDLQVFEKGSNNTITKLRKFIYPVSRDSARWRYIWLSPSIKTETIGSLKRRYITYKIEIDSVQPRKSAAIMARETIGEANPSPPRNTETN